MGALDVPPVSTAAFQTTLTGGSLRGVTGPLERVPFTASTSATTGSGASVATAQGLTGLYNMDGTGQRVVMTIPLNTLPAKAVFRDVVHGRTVGVRWVRDNNAPSFDVVIDGVAYRVADANPRVNNQVVAVADYECLRLIATNLSDRSHTVEVHLIPDGATTPLKTLTLHGWVGERGKGYSNSPTPTTVGSAGNIVSLPASLTAVSGYSGVRAKKIHFCNTDTSSRTVTITSSDGSTTWATRILGIAGTATADGEVVYDPPRSLSGVKWMADAASKVNAWIESA